jgi:hypothetical protein
VAVDYVPQTLSKIDHARVFLTGMNVITTNVLACDQTISICFICAVHFVDVDNLLHRLMFRHPNLLARFVGADCRDEWVRFWPLHYLLFYAAIAGHQSFP